MLDLMARLPRDTVSQLLQAWCPPCLGGSYRASDPTHREVRPANKWPVTVTWRLSLSKDAKKNERVLSIPILLPSQGCPRLEPSDDLAGIA